MPYYCTFEPEGRDSVPAAEVIMTPDTGDVVSACGSHALSLHMQAITALVGEDQLMVFLTDWLGSVLPPETAGDIATDDAGPSTPAPRPRKAGARRKVHTGGEITEALGVTADESD